MGFVKIFCEITPPTSTYNQRRGSNQSFQDRNGNDIPMKDYILNIRSSY